MANENRIPNPTDGEEVDEIFKSFENSCNISDSQKTKDKNSCEDRSKVSEGSSHDDADAPHTTDHTTTEELSDEMKETKRKEAVELKDEANRLYSLGKYEESIKSYNEAIDRCPTCFVDEKAIMFANRAAARLMANTDLEKAIVDCNKAIDMKNNYVKAIWRRAQLYEKVNKPHEAYKDVESVLDFDDKHKEANAAKLRLPEKMRQKDEELKREMLGNLKNLGNMVLKPFGLSTENFQVEQDGDGGSYKIKFKQNQSS